MNLEPGLKIIKKWEGCRLKAYRDSGGKWTIGWGRADSGVHAGMTCTQAEADAWLDVDAHHRAAVILPWITVPVTPNQFGALLSLAYNLGLGGFHHSSVLTAVDSKSSVSKIQAEFMHYVHVGGRVNPGLVNRRKDEFKLYIS